MGLGLEFGVRLRFGLGFGLPLGLGLGYRSGLVWVSVDERDRNALVPRVELPPVRSHRVALVAQRVAVGFTVRHGAPPAVQLDEGDLP